MNLSDFSVSKQRIFLVAVELFASRSYDAVTMTDIAHALGRKKPSIYSHFESKQEILNVTYSFFEAHLFDERKTLDELLPILKTGSVQDMMHAMAFEFPEPLERIMMNILIVIHQRKYFDERARKISKELMIDEGIRYVEEAFNFAIAIGRLAPFDTHWLGLVISDTRNGEYTRASLEPAHDRMDYIKNVEALIYRHAAALIEDLRPPADTEELEDEPLLPVFHRETQMV